MNKYISIALEMTRQELVNLLIFRNKYINFYLDYPQSQ